MQNAARQCASSGLPISSITFGSRDPAAKPIAAWQARQLRARESQLWEWAGERIGATPDDAAVRWVRVCDRGADIYEFLHACAALGHGFVVRAAQDRGLVEPVSGQQVGRLFATARTASALAHFDLELRARPRHAARTARLSVGAAEVHLRAPQRPGKSTGRLPAVACTVVRVWEEQPPPQTEPLEWILLCDGVRTSTEQSLGMRVAVRGALADRRLSQSAQERAGSRAVAVENSRRVVRGDCDYECCRHAPR